MSVKERPLTINGVTFNNYEGFYHYVDTHQSSREKTICSLENQLKTYEEKYKMPTSEFVKNIVGSPAEDSFDFIRWAGDYESYCELTNGKKQ